MNIKSLWDKIKTVTEWVKMLRWLFKAIVVLMALYGGTMGYEMSQKMTGFVTKVDNAVGKIKTIETEIKKAQQPVIINKPVEVRTEKVIKGEISEEQMKKQIYEVIEQYDKDHRIR